MTKFAYKTKVPIGRSKVEIERILSRYKATGFMYASRLGQRVVVFDMNKLRIRFNLPVPEGDSANDQQEERRRWRALVLAIKAKLEAVDSGITTFEEEFLAHIVLPGGKSFGEVYVPQIEQVYESKKLPTMLIGMD